MINDCIKNAILCIYVYLFPESKDGYFRMNIIKPLKV